MKFIKRYFLPAFLLVLCLLTSYALGRAGGGGGRGGGHSGFSRGGSSDGGGLTPFMVTLLAGWGLYTLITSIVLFRRMEIANRILSKISSKDKIWDPEFLREHAKETFHLMQIAWQEKNMNKVKKNVTGALYRNYTHQLNEMRARKETNFISDITLSDIKIICCQDYKDNAKDRYVAYIKGNLLDYTKNDASGIIVKNERKENEDFEDAYYFIRYDNKWLLEDINNDPGFLELIQIKSHTEE